MNLICFTRDKAAELRQAYQKAKASGEDTFIFEGKPMFVPYVKYLLEYLDAQFQPDTKFVIEPLKKSP